MRIENGELRIYLKKLVTGQLSIVNCLKGQSLIELLIAIGLSAILIPALFAGIAASREGRAQESQRLEAAILYREAQEAARSVREKNWNTFATNGTYHPVISGSEWSLVAGSEAISGYTRQIVIADAQRNSSGQIVSNGGTADSSTKKLTITVSWTTPFTSKVETTNYYQRYLGNNAFTDASDTDFAGGAFTNTEISGTGQAADVRLTQSAGAGGEYGNKFRVESTSAIGTMTSANTKTALRFTAQESKTVNAIRVYLHSEVGTSPNYRYGIQQDTTGLPSGTYLCSNILTATSAGWKTISLTGCPVLTSGNVYHIVVQYNSGTVSGSRYVALRRSAPLNNLYPKTNNPDPNANTLFATNLTNWTTQGFQPIYELDFSDATYEGNPYESNLEVAVFGTTVIGEKFTYTGTTQNATSISFYARKQGTPAGSLDFVFGAVGGSQTTCTLASSGVATSFGWITCNFASPVSLTQGTAYRIYLKSSSSASGNDYRIWRLVNTNAANYNSINYDGTNSVYTVSTNGGSSWTDTNVNWDIGGFKFTISGTTTYSANGTFESHTSGSFDAGAAAAFNNIIWTATVPAGTTLQLQAAVSNCSNGTTNPPTCSSGTWDYFGSDGVSGTFFPSSGAIPLSRISGRYVRYKATFTSNGSATPTLNDVSINYSP
ncbi:MAG: type II secretion system protein [Candidatus Blackburnbacteria bacterium]|nr:type II secretion system protein [Candidatus Blackburnbacteria bacterium]